MLDTKIKKRWEIVLKDKLLKAKQAYENLIKNPSLITKNELEKLDEKERDSILTDLLNLFMQKMDDC